MTLVRNYAMQHSWEDPETRLGTVTLLKQLLWPLAARNTLHVYFAVAQVIMTLVLAWNNILPHCNPTDKMNPQNSY